MIDMYSDEVRRNPYPAYEYIRSQGRAVFDTSNNLWFVGHYMDVYNVLKDGDRFSNLEAGVEKTLIGADGLVHSEARKKLTPAFSASILAGIKEKIELRAVEVVAHAVRAGTSEVMDDLSSLVPLSVFSWMYGVQLDNINTFKTWSDAIIGAGRARTTSSNGSPWLHRLKQRLRGRQPNNDLATVRECESWLRGLFMGAIQTSQGGWIYDLLNSHLQNGTFEMDEIIDLSILLIVAATETTTSAIGLTMYHLANSPLLQDQLRNNPELIDSFVEELLRYDGPVQRRIRYVAQDTSIGNSELKRGDRLVLLLGSANRDPAQFNDPDVFIIDRNPNKHLAFGAGSHFCLGSQLARVEIRAVLRAILAQTSYFCLVDSSEQIQHPKLISLRGPRKLHLKFTQ